MFLLLYLFRSSVTKLVNMIFWKQRTDFDATSHKWSMVQRHETITFGGQEVKGQGHEAEGIRGVKNSWPAWVKQVF